jgi:predicted HTH domain antitoxin
MRIKPIVFLVNLCYYHLIYGSYVNFTKEGEMTVQIITPMLNAQKVLELALTLPPVEQKWLVEQFNQLVYDELPESTTVEEAVELYLADQCSLGRAAELAGVTRWDIMDILYERGIPTNGGHELTLEEHEIMFELLEERYDSRE